MTEDKLPLAELLAKSGDADFLRGVAEAVLQMLMEADVEGLIGAGRHERTGERLNWRNGFRDRALDTRLGTLQLRIPKLRQGSYFPPFLEPRKTSEKALVAVIQEAWIGGVSTRRVDELVQAMGLGGIGKSTVSKLCKDIDERVNAFLDRPLEGKWPYLWLDATYLKIREGGRIVSVAAIIAVAVDTEGLVLTESQLAALEKAKTEKEAHGEFESECPGYCGAQDTFYVGTMRGVGRIYQQTFIDTYAKVAFAKLYDRKTPLTAADLLNDRVVPFYDQHEVKLSRVLTDRGTEYCGNPERHEYELYLAVEDVDHSRTKTKSPQTNGIVEASTRRCWTSSIGSR